MTKKHIEKIRELRTLMTLETSNFAKLWDDPGENPLPKREEDVNAFIRERTRVWRETWILPVLDELLEDKS